MNMLRLSMNERARALRTASAVIGLGLLLGLGVMIPVRTAAAETVITFGTYTADKPTVTVRKFKPVLNALEKMLSQTLSEPVKIRTQIAASYAQGIDDLVDGKADFARFGPASYISAKSREPGVSLLAMEADGGSKTFNGVICVHRGSNIQALSELRGRSFAFGSKLSTIGRFLSQKQLLNAGVSAGDLAFFDYLGRHDRVGMAVANREFDAGALKESTYRKIAQKTNALRVLATFPNVTKPWIARSNIDPQLKRALVDGLLTLTDPAALKALKKTGFVAAEDSDFDVIRQAIAESDRFGG